jgi:hypothetical protein
LKKCAVHRPTAPLLFQNSLVYPEIGTMILKRVWEQGAVVRQASVVEDT